MGFYHIVGHILSVTAPAYADASQTKVTVKKGDTVYGISPEPRP